MGDGFYLIGFAALLFPSISVFFGVTQVLVKDFGLVPGCVWIKAGGKGKQP
jgi:hypothetical protein